MRWPALLTAAAVIVPLATGPAPASAAAAAAPPGIPTAVAAAAHLAELTVEAERNSGSYRRTLFPHWATVRGACNVREVLLALEAESVTVNRATCAPTSGRWTSPYDGARHTDPAGLDIEHMVALKEAWESGAHAWTTARRKAFANSLLDGQLWVVTDHVNQAKGDQDPATWRPPLAGFHCTYARAWIGVKRAWELTIDPQEKTALAEMLDAC
ncbi:HNH endonuclease family protein [Nonomuraea sp. NPDC050310]|uniref:HNH endonuclease family protein n=1 Tax=Nonomuraea sp. NPDC050310 TaxID=3154935 RepID=UPI0034039875